MRFVSISGVFLSVSNRIHHKPGGPEPTSGPHLEGEPSCVSVRSDWSMDEPINFKTPMPSAVRKDKQDNSEVSNSLPAQQHQTEVNSIFKVCKRTATKKKHTFPLIYLSVVFRPLDYVSALQKSAFLLFLHFSFYTHLLQLLEDKIITFVKNELKKAQNELNSDYTQSSESQTHDEDMLGSEDEEQRRGSREAFLKITVNFMQKMTQEQLAARLLSNFCELNLDLNTIHRKLKLSDNNRKVVHVEEDQQYVDNDERFDHWPQLLCTNTLTGRCYWEVVWSGEVHVAVAYKGIKQKGSWDDSCFGKTDHSWSLYCDEAEYFATHN
ncbi:uncharacterized protein LOC120725884 isoform X1 [Simochromis diagramma]|uniref:uncharacterized protein LOC120725884 isoform X1 n=1 Tax=Simochromis diagramma TaxID=43689 RepID=UPI001A7EFABD|nr:uncharacterized protein LOC120725884 isoform X1 [Simochromis diagramma]